FTPERDMQVVARCANGEEALRAVRHGRPDVAVVDIRMPGVDGLAVLRAMHEEKLETRVVFFTAAIGEDDLLEAVRLGVAGVVLKEMVPQLLIQCVRKVHAGEKWLERQSFSRALENMLRREAGTREAARILTAREIDIVRMVAGGLRNREIG